MAAAPAPPPTPGPTSTRAIRTTRCPRVRALLVALDDWVSVGARRRRPSRVPTLARRHAGRARTRPGFPRHPRRRRVSRSPTGVAAFGDWVEAAARCRRDLPDRWSSRSIADGNEVAGIRLPDIAVPLGTYTGWNDYKAPYPDGELCRSRRHLRGLRARPGPSGWPRATRGPRSRSATAAGARYVARVDAAVTELVRARLLLPEDAERIRAAALRSDPLAPER